MDESDSGAWERTSRVVTVESPWVRLICERWRDDHGASLEYWRVERAHSVVIVPLWRGRILVPRPQFRPGVGRLTLDLPGGRVPDGGAPLEAARALLHKELGIVPAAVAKLELLDERGWVINSSFSNQLLYGAVAHIDDGVEVEVGSLHAAAPANAAGAAGLLRELECLQCRAVLQEWLLQLAMPSA